MVNVGQSKEGKMVTCKNILPSCMELRIDCTGNDLRMCDKTRRGSIKNEGVLYENRMNREKSK